MIAVLVVFAIGFDFFLILPFFVFIFGIIAMIVSDRKSSSGPAPSETVSEEDARRRELT